MSRDHGLSPVHDRSGIAALEFALIAPIFIALLFGTFAFGLYLTTQIAVTVAASEGARASVGALSSAEAENAAAAAACRVLDGYAPLLSCSQAIIPTPTVSGNTLTISVTYGLPNDGVFALLPFRFTAPSATSVTDYTTF